MKRLIRYTVIAIAALALVLLAGAWWLFRTTGGARWAIDQVSRFTPLTITIDSVEGTLAGTLRIEGLQATWPRGSAQVRELAVDWAPETLVTGRIGLRTLSIQGVRVQDDRPDAPAAPGFNWPQKIGLPLLPFRVRSLVLEDVEYRRRAQPPVRIDRAEADVRLSQRELSVRRLSLALPQVRVSGRVTVGLGRPRLRTSIEINPVKPQVGFDMFRIRADLDHAESPALLTGPLDISAFMNQEKLIDAKATATVTGKSILLKQATASRPGRIGSITGAMELIFAEEPPAFGGTIVLHDLDLSREIAGFNSLNGSVSIRGSLREYRGSLSLSNRGPDLKTGRLEAEFEGTTRSVALTSIDAAWLDGTVTGSLDAEWKGAPSLSVALQARGLNPARAAPEWPGSVNADLKGSATLPQKEKPRGKISLRLLKSTLRSRPLTGALEARYDQGSVRVDRLAFTGRGFDVKASGSLEERIDYAITLTDLSLLLEQAEGRASASGWVRKTREMLSGQVRARARNLSYKGLRAARAVLNGEVKAGAERPFSLELTGRDVEFNALRTDSMAVNASGSFPDHTIRVSLQSTGAGIRAAITGAYNEHTWQGAIVRLSGTDSLGEWKLREPASVSVSGSRFSLSPLVLAGNAGERIEAKAAIETGPLSGSFSLEWKELSISRLNEWLDDVAVTGTTNGRISGKIIPEEGLIVAADAAIDRGTVTRRIEDLEVKADIKAAEFTANWEGQRLEGRLSLVLSEYGRINAAVSLPVPARLPVDPDENGALRGSISGQVRESGMLSFLFPGLVQESRAQLELNVRVGGTWASPDISGSAALENAGAYFPAAGIQVTDIQLAAAFEENSVRITSFSARSGPGRISGKAVITLEGWRPVRYEGSLTGERFRAMNLPQLLILASPDIEFQGTLQKLSARGSVLVPELLIHGAPDRGAVEPSEDVVIVGVPAPEQAGPGGRLPALDVEIKVILGDRAIVNAEGIDAKLGGQITLSISSVKKITAKGEIKVIEGKYSTYGVKLDIKRGKLFFAGGPIGNPTLDILAVRTVNDVEAGVLVTGTLQRPVIKLYSEPAMPDADILAYVVLGHPLGQNREQASLLLQAASALLSKGESVALRDQIRNRLGLDVFDIEAGEGELSRSLVTVGKYLSSRLYVSYGYALFSGESLFRLKYRISKRLELESRTGKTSGVDLYYTVRFD